MKRKIEMAAALLFVAALGCSRDKSAEIDKHLIDLKSEDAVTRRDAVIALGELGAAAADAVPALARLLNDENDDIRVAVAQALAKIGPEARAALPALEKATKDRDDRVQAAAAQTIQKIKGG